MFGNKGEGLLHACISSIYLIFTLAYVVKSVCNNLDVVPLEVYKVDIQYQVSYTPFPSGRTSLLGGNRRIINMLQKARRLYLSNNVNFI